jgi:magnesium transporter
VWSSAELRLIQPSQAHIDRTRERHFFYPDPMASSKHTVATLPEDWSQLSPQARCSWLRALPQRQSHDLFLHLTTREQMDLLLAFSDSERHIWLRLLPPDDLADLLQTAGNSRPALVSLLDDATRLQVTALLAYKEDLAGGLMSPRFVRVRPEMTADEAITYVRLQSQVVETLYYLYILDEGQRLLGVLSLRELFSCPKDQIVRDVMRPEVLSVPDSMDQEAVAQLFARSDLIALPVVDTENRMKGIITIDDIVDVFNEEASEDIHKFGGMEALHAPYLDVGFGGMLRKRAGWLAALFIGEMLTAAAMARFQDDIAKAVVLTLFIPLIISSGGNAGSQASTLVIRAMAVGELGARDWWIVLRRELPLGWMLGIVLACIGVLRIMLWQLIASPYGSYAAALAATVGLSLVGVVFWGTVLGALLPFALRAVRLDPASASAPFVATMVDVSGVLIYFTVARIVLREVLL